MVKATRRLLYQRERTQLLILQEAEWASELVWKVEEYLARAVCPLASRYSDYSIPGDVKFKTTGFTTEM